MFNAARKGGGGGPPKFLDRRSFLISLSPPPPPPPPKGTCERSLVMTHSSKHASTRYNGDWVFYNHRQK